MKIPWHRLFGWLKRKAVEIAKDELDQRVAKRGGKKGTDRGTIATDCRREVPK